MALPPCHKTYQFHVSGNRLSGLLYQRSCDVALGLPFNLWGAALFLRMLAQQCDLEPGELVWMGGDVHLYLNHADLVEAQIARTPAGDPRLDIVRRPDSMFDYRIEDFVVRDYQPAAHIAAPVACGRDIDAGSASMTDAADTRAAGAGGRGNLPPLALHVPEPKFRPGDTVDYSHIKVPPAGAQPRPDESCAASETHSLCLDLVRVLDDENRAVGPWNPKLDAETLRRMLRMMALTPRVRRSHVSRPAAGQDQLLHEVYRRGSDLDRAGDGAGA
ncbi:hypothetical protein Lal_00011099 [Lupinus albus]|nr:hypothetical protein Lal_00011099 [Lupinus albus]